MKSECGISEVLHGKCEIVIAITAINYTTSLLLCVCIS